MKKFLVITLALILCVTTFMFGVNLFGKHIYNKQSCGSFNIDNIELRTGVNIPAISNSDCNCTNNKKTATFSIDIEKVNLDDYISRNEFVIENTLYVKVGDNKNSSYKVVLDRENAELTIDLIYKDNIDYFLNWPSDHIKIPFKGYVLTF